MTTCITPPILSTSHMSYIYVPNTCTIHIVVGGKSDAHVQWSTGILYLKRQHPLRYSNYLEDFWACAGGLSAVCINSGMYGNHVLYSRKHHWKSNYVAIY